MPKQHHRDHAAGPSQRALRVGELVRHALADMFIRGEVHEAGFDTSVITVPEVRMSPDLRLATVYVMPMGGRGRDEALAALNRITRSLRGEVARRVNLKFAPELRFRIDERFDEAARIDRLLHSPEVARDLATDNESDADR